MTSEPLTSALRLRSFVSPQPNLNCTSCTRVRQLERPRVDHGRRRAPRDAPVAPHIAEGEWRATFQANPRWAP